MHLSWGVINTYLKTGPTRWSRRVLPPVHPSLITNGVFLLKRTVVFYLQSVTANFSPFKPILTSCYLLVLL